jgi:hypothetical protein
MRDSPLPVIAPVAGRLGGEPALHQRAEVGERRQAGVAEHVGSPAVVGTGTEKSTNGNESCRLPAFEK